MLWQSSANPSSIHAAGRAARALVETARASVADLVAVRPEAVTFVSGGTEANALAIHSAVAAGFKRIVVGATEHDAVRACVHATGTPVDVWPVDGQGVADLDWLETALARGDPALVCLMLANNETGVIQPVVEAARRVRASRWVAARGRGSGRREAGDRHGCAGRRHSEPVGPQARRSVRRWRSGLGPSGDPDPSAPWRRPGAGPPRRHGKSLRHRRFRRRRAGGRSRPRSHRRPVGVA